MEFENIPTKPDQVTKVWLQETLEKATKSSVRVLNLVPLKTEGYLSTACKATVQIGENVPEKIFLKITLPSDDPLSAFINTYNIDINEVRAYRETLPKLVNLEKELCQGLSKLEAWLPKFYAGGSNKETKGFFLILQDISEEFKVRPNDIGLSISETKKALQVLAHFHGLSYAYKVQKGLDWSKVAPVFYPKFMQDPSLVSVLEPNFQLMIQDMTQDGLDPDLIAKVELMKQNCKPLLSKYLSQGTEEKDFLAHGDYWGNNVMYNSETEARIIDWQFNSAMPPCIDVVSLAFYNSPPELIKPELDGLFDCYYETLEACCLSFKVDKVPFTKGQFVEDVYTRGLPTMLAFFMFFYDPVGHKDSMRQRIYWTLQLVLEKNPNFLKL